MTRAARRAQIAAAALRVLARDGHARLTARKVAAEAGLALGHITYNFAGMDEVLAEAYRLASNDLRAATEAALSAAGGPQDRLRAFLRAGFSDRFLAPDHLRLRLDLWAAAQWHPQIAATERALYAAYRAALLDLLPGGPEPARDRVADTVMAALDGLWADYARRQDAAALERGLQGCEDLIRLSLAPAESGGHAAAPGPSPR
ncbi:TetR family transcriptional regulator C-terminal domain-containing protein [Rhodobacter sp. Har01]|uniref:TetR/AcrR family transcriptional regulator n=1 Tax=Rhodobacter sp. Har01 TaxID=2883999 RepID=UPI001D07178B|nr:TetR family transcriptional regulator C-terminal domain-containing protein [Rhodobacter sp. Har01]MCB6178248.1 TetR family transcriptional regulator C-terminal domain-containing protein [Rhodobacter sp. Har01]